VKNQWPNSVREPVYAADAPKQTVSLTINSDLFARVKSLGINASRIAEEALVQELERHRRAVILAEVEADVRAADAYMAKHGNHGELVLEYLEGSMDSLYPGKG
jgi:post-segregation antitoxin (ccd killing protein)